MSMVYERDFLVPIPNLLVILYVILGSENRSVTRKALLPYIVNTVLPIVGSHGLLKVACSTYAMRSTTVCSF